jgi:hypothetical protein
VESWSRVKTVNGAELGYGPSSKSHDFSILTSSQRLGSSTNKSNKAHGEAYEQEDGYMSWHSSPLTVNQKITVFHQDTMLCPLATELTIVE